MKIGIDIDGVLIDIAQFETDLATKFYVERGIPLSDPDGYGSLNMFGKLQQLDDEFWSKAIYNYVKLPARPFASEVIRKLKDRGHEIFIITNRCEDLSYCDITQSQMKKIVVKWLQDNEIYYDELVFTRGDKLPACLDRQVGVMIEDNPRLITQISAQVPVIVYDARYNRANSGKNIIRCYSWYDIYDTIQNKKLK